MPDEALNDQTKDCDMTTRQALLLIIDAIERKHGVDPRTSELRKWYKAVECGKMVLVTDITLREGE